MKTAIDRITVEGRDYVPVDSVSEIDGEIKIVLLQRGWVMVGVFERNGSDCQLHKASVIRKWGTTKGLGQIANDGPTNETVLDKCHGIVEFDYLTVIATIACRGDKWEKEL